MQEKEKSKANPFAAFLRPTEDLLWQTKSTVTTMNTVMPAVKAALMLAMLITLFIVSFQIMITKKPDTTQTTIGLALFMLFGVLSYFLRVPSIRSRLWTVDSSQPGFYAVTSERLFFNQADNIRALPLEKISSINVLARDTLSFGPVFPQWTGLEDAQHVKHIIEQARKEHLKGDHL
jgi:hypothetical protein